MDMSIIYSTYAMYKRINLKQTSSFVTLSLVEFVFRHKSARTQQRLYARSEIETTWQQIEDRYDGIDKNAPTAKR
jgi:hypothetical protein